MTHTPEGITMVESSREALNAGDPNAYKERKPQW